MRYVLALVVGIVSWYLLTIGFGVVWTLLGMPYSPAYSDLLNLVLLPVGLLIGWRFVVRRENAASSGKKQ